MKEKQARVECHECGLEGAIGNMYRLELYDSPWDAEPKIAYVHRKTPARLKNDNYLKYVDSCIDLLEDSSWADFRYFDCDGCGRTICEQNPANGWHRQIRYLDEGDTKYCLKCYEEHILENGLDREDLEQGKLPGMFFSGDNHEPLDAGYTYDMRDYFVGDPTPIIARALELIDSGHQVVIGYESMAIGGLGGTVSLFVKNKNMGV